MKKFHMKQAIFNIAGVDLGGQPGQRHDPFTASGHQDPECINGYGNRSVFASGCLVFRQDPGIRPRICHIRAETPMESASGEPFVI